MKRHRDSLVERLVLSSVDYGNQGFEIQFDTSSGVAAVLVPPKPLLQDRTRLEIDQYGDLINMVQPGLVNEVVLPVSENMHVAFRVEGSNWNGEPLLINAVEVFQDWREVRTITMRFDTKLAAGQLVIRYPADQVVTLDQDGNEVATSEIARRMGEKFQSGGVLTMSKHAIADQIQTMQTAQPDWDFEMMDTGKTKPEFNARMAYYDKLKVRAMGFPERAILEAESAGSRADSVTAAGFAIQNLELLHKLCSNEISRQLINKILLLNFGPEAVDTVRMVPGKISQEHKTMLTELAGEILKARPDIVDINSLMDELDIPKSGEVILDTTPDASQVQEEAE
jgi:hypothetical protein